MEVIRILFVAAAITGLLITSAGTQANNLSFEQPDVADATAVPKPWVVVGRSGRASLDTERPHTGARSVRLEQRGDSTGVSQVIDAIPWRGKVVVVRAFLRARGLGDGPVGIWVRAEAAGQRIWFDHSYDQPLKPDDEWTERTALAYVSPQAERLFFGAMIAASGTLWVDSFSLEEYESAAETVDSQSVAYVDEVIAQIKSKALHADQVNWDKLRPALLAVAGRRPFPAGAHQAARYALLSLADGHSFFLTPQQRSAALDQDDRRDGFGVVGQAVGPQGYIRIPGFAGGTSGRVKAFRDALVAEIARLDGAGARCWVVDLRFNGGGNMDPMIGGISPLLGDGVVGAFHRKGGRTDWRVHADGRDNEGEQSAMRIEGVALRSATHELRSAPVAVLMGAKTASSGEATVVSFLGRPNTRTFGAPTAGQSSANRGVRLSDGAMLLITNALFADRTGRVYGGKITPDVAVAESANGPLDAQPAVVAAVKWLSEQKACRDDQNRP